MKDLHYSKRQVLRLIISEQLPKVPVNEKQNHPHSLGENNVIFGFRAIFLNQYVEQIRSFFLDVTK